MHRLSLWVTIFAATALLACSTEGGKSSSGDGDDTGTEGTGDDETASDCAYAGAYATEGCNPLCPEDRGGCDEGFSCTFVGAGFGCVQIPTGEGEAADLWKGCNDEKPCKQGGCIDVPELGKKCSPFCKEDADCGAEYQCSVELSYGGTAPILMCAPRPAACSVYKQDCPEGEGCYLAGGTGCYEVGEAKKGDDCSEVNSCLKGLLCVSDRCHEVCNPKTNGPDPKCHLFCPTGGAIQGVPDIGVCPLPDNEPACNIMGDNSDCPAGQICYYVAYTGGRCRKPGSGAVSSKCDDEEDCAEGLACFPSGTNCKAMCNPAEAMHNECSNVGVPCSPLPGSAAGFCDE